MATLTISSQSFLNDEIVAVKREARDYTVSVSPTFEVGGLSVRVVLDGHHSLAAAAEDGVEPEWRELDASEHDAIALIDSDPALFLEAVYLDSEYHDIATGRSVW